MLPSAAMAAALPCPAEVVLSALLWLAGLEEG